jgi:hypothetical protein
MITGYPVLNIKVEEYLTDRDGSEASSREASLY